VFYLIVVRWNKEPIWDTIILMSRYNLGEINGSQDTVRIPGKYQVKGRFSPDAIDISEKNEKV